MTGKTSDVTRLEVGERVRAAFAVLQLLSPLAISALLLLP